MTALLIMKEQLINELTEMGVVNGQLIDLNAFDVIPNPPKIDKNVSKEKKKINNSSNNSSDE